MAHITAQPLADGQTIAVEVGPVTVAVQCVRLGAAYRLSIRRGSTGAEVDELSRSVPTERHARSAARMAVTLFRAGLTVQQALDMLAVFAPAA
jgi:hypothetical protein